MPGTVLEAGKYISDRNRERKKKEKYSCRWTYIPGRAGEAGRMVKTSTRTGKILILSVSDLET